MTSTMRNGDEHLDDTSFLDDVATSATKSDDRSSIRLVAYFDVSPANAFTPSGAQRFENRFLGSPASGKMLGGRFPTLAILNLVRCINTSDKLLAVPIDHLSDPQTLDNIRSDSDNLGHL